MYDTTMCCIESSLITTESGMNGKWRHKECAQPHQPRTTPGMFSLGRMTAMVLQEGGGLEINITIKSILITILKLRCAYIVKYEYLNVVF